MNLRDEEKKLERFRLRFRELRIMLREVEWGINQLPESERGEFILRKEKIESEMHRIEELIDNYEFLDSLGLF